MMNLWDGSSEKVPPAHAGPKPGGEPSPASTETTLHSKNTGVSKKATLQIHQLRETTRGTRQNTIATKDAQDGYLDSESVHTHFLANLG